MKNLTYPVAYEYHTFHGTYDELVYQVYLQNFDAVVGDVTIIANRSLYVDFTLPFTESGVSMVVPIKDKSHNSAWIFTDPLTADLWFASLAFFFFTGFVVWFLEHRINDEFRGTPNHQLGTTFYFSFSTLVFAHREVLLSNLSRVVVIIWVFVVLILTHSYTATLTSILTSQQFQPTMGDLNDLLRSQASVGYLKDSFIPNLLKGMKFNSSKLIPYNSPQQYHEALSNGSVAAIVDEIPYLKVFLNSQHCKNYMMVGPTYKSDGFGFVFPKGSPLVPDVSRAILRVIKGNLMDLENILYENYTCPNTEGSLTTSSILSFKRFRGLFLISGVTSISAMLLHLVLFLYENPDKLRPRDVSESYIRQKLAILAKLYTQTDYGSHEPNGIDKEGPVMVDVMASPDTVSGMRSPSMMSSYIQSDSITEDEIESPLEGEGSPDREISSQNPDPPSFADMLRQRLE